MRIEEIQYKTKRKTYPVRRKKASTTRVQTKAKKVPVKKKKKPQRGKLVAKLDAVMSTWNRTRFAANGIVKCYTCPKAAPIKSMQNGHYVSRSVRKLRWEPDNMRPQCYGCNVMHGGQPITFRENLIAEIGESAVKELEALRHELFTPTDEWLQEQIEAYTYLTNMEQSLD